MVQITGKSKLQTSDSMLSMLLTTIVVIVIAATLFLSAAIQFNDTKIVIISIFFQMLTICAVLLNAMFLIKIEQKVIKNKK